MAAAGLLAAALTACSSPADRALAPTTTDGYDTDPTGFFAAVETSPTIESSCGADVEWDDPPVIDQVVAVGYVQTVWMVGERGGNELVWVCDYLPEEAEPVTAEPMANTGTDQPVGNDYVQRVGNVLGRVDIGVPEGAVTAEYAVGDYVVDVLISELDELQAEVLGQRRDQSGLGEQAHLDQHAAEGSAGPFLLLACASEVLRGDQSLLQEHIRELTCGVQRRLSCGVSRGRVARRRGSPPYPA